MIAFGCAVTRSEDYERFAAPGIGRAREPDSTVYANSSAGSIFRAYNLLLDQAGSHPDLEALVLLHQDVEIVDAGFAAKVRQALSGPDVAVAGCVGALDARSMAWWEGSVTWASFTHRYYEHGGGEIPAFAMHPERHPLPAFARTGPVDTIDGFLMVLSPWAVRNLRFDESLGQSLHGYDFDLCRQARAAGHEVVTVDVKVVHHHSLELLSDPENWVSACVALREKWEPAPHGISEEGWRRVVRAEAEASAARTLRISAEMQYAARERELQRELDEIRGSVSWQVTGPLRRLSARLRARRLSSP